MSCKKYILTNPTSKIIYFNYQECTDLNWSYQNEIFPNQSLNVWAFNGTFSYVGTDLVVDDEGVFPPEPEPEPSQTPTPSITPTLTPTTSQTPTPTPTSSETPTPTPTPSATPLVPLNPSDLGALWWLDFTNYDSILEDGDNVYAAKNLVTDAFEFSAATPNNAPLYDSNGYYDGMSYSGTAQSYIEPLTNLKGTYSAVTQFTVVLYANWTPPTQFGAVILRSMSGQSDYEGNVQNANWGYLTMPGDPTISAVTFNYVGDLVAIAGELPDNQWNLLTVRHTHIMETNTAILEGFMDNVLVTSASSVNDESTIIDPIFALLYDGGNFKVTEFSFFDRALTNGELDNLYEYILQKYSI